MTDNTFSLDKSQANEVAKHLVKELKESSKAANTKNGTKKKSALTKQERADMGPFKDVAERVKREQEKHSLFPSTLAGEVKKELKGRITDALKDDEKVTLDELPTDLRPAIRRLALRVQTPAVVRKRVETFIAENSAGQIDAAEARFVLEIANLGDEHLYSKRTLALWAVHRNLRVSEATIDKSADLRAKLLTGADLPTGHLAHVEDHSLLPVTLEDGREVTLHADFDRSGAPPQHFGRYALHSLDSQNQSTNYVVHVGPRSMNPITGELEVRYIPYGRDGHPKEAIRIVRKILGLEETDSVHCLSAKAHLGYQEASMSAATFTLDITHLATISSPGTEAKAAHGYGLSNPNVILETGLTGIESPSGRGNGGPRVGGEEGVLGGVIPDGVDPSDFNDVAAAYTALLNNGNTFTRRDYEQDPLALLNIPTAGFYLKAWIQRIASEQNHALDLDTPVSEDDLRSVQNEEPWTTYCAEFAHGPTNIFGPNFVPNDQNFRALFGDTDGPKLLDALYEMGYLTGEFDYEPAWKRQGLKTAQVRAFDSVKQCADYRTSVLDPDQLSPVDFRNGYGLSEDPAGVGVGFAYQPLTVADLIKDFVELNAPFYHVGGLTQALVLFQEVSELQSRTQLTRDQVQAHVLELSSSLLLAELRTLPVVDRAARLEQYIAAIGDRSGLSGGSLEGLRTSIYDDEDFRGPKLDRVVASQFARLHAAEAFADARDDGDQSGVNYYTPPSLASSLFSGHRLPNPGFTVRSIGILADWSAMVEVEE